MIPFAQGLRRAFARRRRSRATRDAAGRDGAGALRAGPLRARASLGALAAVLALALLSPAHAAAPAAVAPFIAALVAADTEPVSARVLSAPSRAWLAQVYAPAQGEPVWFGSDGARSAAATALAQLRGAGGRGLAPDDYDVAALAEALAQATSADATPERVARADVALTSAVLRFMADLRQGRVAPQSVLPHFRVDQRPADFAAALRATVAADTLAAAIDAAEPSFPLYARLKRQLARYRALAAQAFAPLPALPAKTAKVEPGEAYAGAAALHQRLVLLGDLAAESAAPSDGRYARELAEAVRRFQGRHGLTPDGVLGPQTLAALDVPPAARVHQIELSLERLRWLPALPRGPVIAVNIPSFKLWVFDRLPESDRPALAMAVIVGRAMRTRTPVFIGDMRYLEFSPYWNVPPSILHGELLPQLARDASYLARQDMEMVPVKGGGPATTTVDAATLASLRAGELRLRQRPGERNALGGVKFVLPNTMDIYLHGTPARQLFERTRRDFSHGCIRVADPAALAQFVLRDQPEWTPARIDAAMASGRNAVVKLTTTVPVIVFYTTAIVGSDERPLFLPDVYGHDRTLDEALARERPR